MTHGRPSNEVEISSQPRSLPVIGIFIENYLDGGLERMVGDLLCGGAAGFSQIYVFDAGDGSSSKRLRLRCPRTVRWIQVNLICLPNFDRPINSGFLKKATRRCLVGIITLLRWGLMWINVAQCKRVLRKNKVDTLHVVNGGYPAAFSCLSAVLAAKGSGVRRVLFSVTGIPAERRIPIIERIGDKAVFSRVDAWVAVCRAAAEALCERRGFVADRICVVPPGIEVSAVSMVKDRSKLLNTQNLVIGNLSVLRRYKGQHVLLDAVQLLKPLYPNIKVEIIGEGPERGPLVDQARRLKIDKNVIMLGNLTDEESKERMSAWDVFVHATFEDAFPYVILEAMSLKVPIVASRVGGISEQIVDNISGRLVQPGHPNELAEVLREILQSPEIAVKFAQVAHERVRQHFSLEKMLSDFYMIYRDVGGRNAIMKVAQGRDIQTI